MIRINVETSHWITDPADPDDSWDRDNTDGSIDSVSAEYVEQGEDRGYRGMGWGDGDYDIDARPGDIVHVVIAQYGTGNTFGQDGCQISVMDVFKDNSDAVSLYAALRDVKDFSVKHNGRDYYVPWVGYFEWLQDLDIRTLVVQNHCGSY
jgi:hypothetical protein